MMLDVGEARPAVVESTALRAHRCRTAQQCMEMAARLMVLATELDPDIPGAIVPGVAMVQPLRAAARDQAFSTEPRERR